jgi:hypothetical protein
MFQPPGHQPLQPNLDLRGNLPVAAAPATDEPVADVEPTDEMMIAESENLQAIVKAIWRHGIFLFAVRLCRFFESGATGGVVFFESGAKDGGRFF